MLKILNTSKAFSQKTNVGRKVKLEVLDCLIITLMYWREYRTFRHIAYDYGVGKKFYRQSNIMGRKHLNNLWRF